MSIFNHNIYDNIRTRTIVLYQGCLLLHPPSPDEEAWRLPGGGLEAHESLADCARREVLEETGIPVRVGNIAFLREWVVPRYTGEWPEVGGTYGYGLEIYHYAYPEEPVPSSRPENLGDQPARWIPLADVPGLPLWPKELKHLAERLLRGQAPTGITSFTSQLNSPWARDTHDPFDD